MTCSLMVIMLVIQLTRLGLMSLDILRWNHEEKSKVYGKDTTGVSSVASLLVTCI